MDLGRDRLASIDRSWGPRLQVARRLFGGGARSAAVTLLVLGLAWALRRDLVGRLDLSNLPGAAGGRLVARVAANQTHRGWGEWMAGWTRIWADEQLGLPLAADTAALWVSMGASLAMVAGAMLGGIGTHNRVTGLAAGAVAATWALSVQTAWFIGIDGTAMGIGWLAVGLAWFGARNFAWGLPLLFAGGALLGWGHSVKELALPLLPLLGAAIVLAEPTRPRPMGRFRMAQAAVLSAGVATSWALFAPVRAHTKVQVAAPSLQSMADGLTRLHQLPDLGFPQGLFPWIFWAAVAGAALPGERWDRRLLLGLATVGSLLYTAASLGEDLMPAFLLGPSFGIVILVGALLQIVGHALWGNAGALVAIALGASFLTADTLAFTDQWDRHHSQHGGTDRASLPSMPTWLTNRHEHLDIRGFRRLQLEGGGTLRRLMEAEQTGLIIPRLRDERHHDVIAFGRLLGQPTFVLDPRKCCAGATHPPSPGQPIPGTLARCARRVVDEAQRTGMTLVLPQIHPRWRQVDAGMDGWVNALTEAASQRAGWSQIDLWWNTLPPHSQGGSLSCERIEPLPPQQSSSNRPRLPVTRGLLAEWNREEKRPGPKARDERGRKE